MRLASRDPLDLERRAPDGNELLLDMILHEEDGGAGQGAAMAARQEGRSSLLGVWPTELLRADLLKSEDWLMVTLWPCSRSRIRASATWNWERWATVGEEEAQESSRVVEAERPRRSRGGRQRR